jgi:hypothetical protein
MPYADDEPDSRTPQQKRMGIQNLVRTKCMAIQTTLDTLLSMIGKKSGFGQLERAITDSKKLISFHVEWQQKKDLSGRTQYLNRDTDKTQYEKPVPDAAKYKINLVRVDNTQIFQQADDVRESLDKMLGCFYNTGDYSELIKIVKRCKQIIKVYVEWEERTNPKDKKKKIYYNRKLNTVQSEPPLPDGWYKNKGLYIDRDGHSQSARPLFTQSRLGLKFMPRIDEVYEAGGINTDRCLQNDTSSDVQFLLRIAEVNDAEEVLHAMRLMLA